MLKLQRHTNRLKSPKFLGSEVQEISRSQPRCIQFLKRGHKGWAFIFAIYITVFVLLLALLIYKQERTNLVKEEVEDTLAVSALGCVDTDVYLYIMSGNMIFSDVDDSYELLCNLIAKNLGLRRNGVYMSAAGVDKYNEAMLTKYYPVCIQKVILYENVDGTINSYEYTHSGNITVDYPLSIKAELLSTPNGEYKKTTSSGTNVQTPTGETVDTLSVYIELVYPMETIGSRKYFKQKAYVILESE